MTGIQATNAANLYGMDPMFYQYYMSQVNNQQTAATAQTATNTAQAPKNIDSRISFEGNTSTINKETEKSSNSTAKLIIGTTMALGAAWLCRKAYIKGGSGSFTERITKGFKQMWKGITNKSSDAAKGLTAQKNKAGEWYCTIPEKQQSIKLADAAKFDIATDIPKLGTEGTKAKAFTFSFNGKDYFVKDGKITNNKELLEQLANATDDASVNLKNKLGDIIEQLQSGKNVEGVTLKKMLYTHEANGVTRTFRTDATNKAKEGIRSIWANRFTPGADEVIAYAERSGDDVLKNAVNAIREGKVPEGLNIGKAEYALADGKKLIIEGNNKITGIKIDGVVHKLDSDKFLAWKSGTTDVEKLFEKALSEEGQKAYTNIRYQQFI